MFPPENKHARRVDNYGSLKPKFGALKSLGGTKANTASVTIAAKTDEKNDELVADLNRVMSNFGDSDGHLTELRPEESYYDKMLDSNCEMSPTDHDVKPAQKILILHSK